MVNKIKKFNEYFKEDFNTKTIFEILNKAINGIEDFHVGHFHVVKNDDFFVDENNDYKFAFNYNKNNNIINIMDTTNYNYNKIIYNYCIKNGIKLIDLTIDDVINIISNNGGKRKKIKLTNVLFRQDGSIYGLCDTDTLDKINAEYTHKPISEVSKDVLYDAIIAEREDVLESKTEQSDREIDKELESRIEDLKDGDVLYIGKKCYIRREYDRTTKKYFIQDYDDISRFKSLKKGTVVRTACID